MYAQRPFSCRFEACLLMMFTIMFIIYSRFWKPWCHFLQSLLKWQLLHDQYGTAAAWWGGRQAGREWEGCWFEPRVQTKQGAFRPLLRCPWAHELIGPYVPPPRQPAREKNGEEDKRWEFNEQRYDLSLSGFKSTSVRPENIQLIKLPFQGIYVKKKSLKNISVEFNSDHRYNM